jgi:hypothetical protein
MTEESDHPSQTDLEKLILGTWDWKYTIHDYRGVRPPNDRTTPESAGYKEQRRFLENGQVQTYRDGELTETRPYRIEVTWAVRPGLGIPYCHIYIGEQKKAAFGLTADTLEIAPRGFGNCGSTIVYTRAESITSNDA